MIRLAAFVAACSALGVAQRASSGQTVLSRTTSFSDVAVSPDGSRTAWIQSKQGEPGRLHVGAKEVQLKATPRGEDSEPAFSPDGRQLAFFSTAGSRDGDQKQLFLGTTPRSRLNGYAARPRWSHDG